MTIHTNENLIINLIFENYADMVYRIAYQQTHNRCEAEDITQDVFLKLIKKSFFQDEEHLKAWLIRVTINRCHDYQKSSKRKEISLEQVSHLPFQQESSDMNILFNLPELDRTILFLHYFEGYTAKEIGKILKKSENSIFIRLSRARKKLEAILKEEE